MVGQRVFPDEEDWAEVEVLRARLEKTIQLTKKIKTSQLNLERSGRNVRDAIGPVHGNTQELQITSTNIENVNDALEGVRRPMDVKAREEPIIYGRWRIGDAEYLASVRRMLAVVSRSPDSDSPDLYVNTLARNELLDLFKDGVSHLEQLFGRKLEAESIPVEPLHYVTKQLPFPSLAEQTLPVLIEINTILEEPVVDLPRPKQEGIATISTYIRVRSKYITSSLENLAAASLNTAKKVAPDAMYRRGTNGLATYATALEGLLRAEYQIVRAIFTPPEAISTLKEICNHVIGGLGNLLKELNAHIRANLATDCYLAFEIVAIITALSYEINELVGDYPLKYRLDSLLQPILDTAKISLPELLDDTKRRIMLMQTLPSDGATVPVTVDTMARLQNMTEFLQPVSDMLVSIGEGNWTSITSVQRSAGLANQASSEVGEKGKRLFARYCLDTIDLLLQNLDAKATNVYKNKTVIGVFLLNNVATVERAIRNSDLGRVSLTEPPALVESWRKKGMALFKEGWKGPSTFLFEAQYTNRGGHRPPSGGASAVNSAEIVKGLTGKERDAIKDRFRSFNGSFDEMVGRQKGLAMEKEVRASLAREVQGTIEPLYGRFWDRYHEIDKGKGKYVKYDKGQLAAVLAGLG
ncbi:MAG: exocyst complex component exo70 [Peltula sp. TS41687]|nr:MAG: exocyst complex component exo70 [Peltula sp. TS41687]